MGGDMAVQFHVAFSASVTGVCGHDAQPYRCAITRFPGDALVPASSSSSVPHCDGCPPNLTLVYDHCKNHPEWVDVGMLPDYPRRIGGGIDDTDNLLDTDIYLTRSECKTYVGGAEANTFGMYAMMVHSPDEQMKYTDFCAVGRILDRDATCIEHVLRPGSKAARRGGNASAALHPPASQGKRGSIFAFEQAPHLDAFNLGFADVGYIYVPDKCLPSSDQLPAEGCRLFVHFHGCGAGEPMGPMDTMVRYAESNGFVILRPVIQNPNNASASHTNANEIARGCWDGYGQLSADYATKSAPHMRNLQRMVQHLGGNLSAALLEVHTETTPV